MSGGPRPFHGEEAVTDAVEKLLTEGGKILYDHYLDRKAFPFAAEAVSGSIMGTMRCTFVPHEDNAEEGGSDDCWEMETEPGANPIDSWARMYVPTRRRTVRGASDDGSANAGGAAAATSVDARSTGQAKAKATPKKQTQGARGPDTSEEALKGRQTKISEIFPVDNEEDMLRDFKAAEEKKRRDEEQRAKKAAERRAEELKKLEAQHEEMRRRQFTYDSDGNVVWVEQPNVDRLPKISELIPFKFPKGEGAAADLDASGKKELASPKKKGQGGAARGKKANADVFAFTDGFTKLATQQPPIIEVLVPKSGVLLEHKGRKKKGPPVEKPEGSMSREEYKQLTENEDAMGGGQSTMPSQAAKAGGDADSAKFGEDTEQQTAAGDASSLPPVKETAGGGRGGAGGAAFSDLAPATGGGAAGSPSAKGGASPDGAAAGGGAWAEKAPGRKGIPIAPQPSFKSKLESIGHLPRAPRQHVGPLGMVYGHGRFPQPPVGATMGHGLLRARANSSREFFFPDMQNTPPLYETMGTSPTNLSLLSRTQSEGSFRGPRTGFPPAKKDPFDKTQNPYIWRKGPPAKIQGNSTATGYKNFRAALASLPVE